MFALAVWREETGDEILEHDGVVPLSWIDEDDKILRWPNKKNAMADFKKKSIPEDDWKSFQLIKIKITSGMSIHFYTLFIYKLHFTAKRGIFFA